MRSTNAAALALGLVLNGSLVAQSPERQAESGRGGLTGRGFGGLGLRSLALWGGAIGAFAICGWDCYGGSDATVAGVVALAGMAVGTGLAIHDLATLTRAVARHRTASIAVVPTFRLSDRALGISVRATF